MDANTSDRLARLEREARLFRVACLLLVAVLGAAVLVAQSPAQVVQARYAFLPPDAAGQPPGAINRVQWRQMDLANGTVYTLWCQPHPSAPQESVYYVTTINPMTGLFQTRELGK